MKSDTAAQRTSDELVVSTKAVVSWIQQSQFPIQDKFVFRNNIVRTLLAINRREAEMRQVGRDTRFAEIAHYREWYLWPKAIDNHILEQKRKLWLRLKAWHKRNQRRKET